MARDFSEKVAALIDRCSGLPDLTIGEHLEAAFDAAQCATGATMTLDRGEHVCPPLTEAEEDLARERFDQAAAVFAVHYGLDQAAVWDALYDLEAELIEAGGLPWFGRLLNEPVGWTALGIRVAEKVTGLASDALPVPFMLPERDLPPVVITPTAAPVVVREVPVVPQLTEEDWFFRIALWDAGLLIADHCAVSFETVRGALNHLPQEMWPLVDSPEGWGALAAHVSRTLGLDAGAALNPTIH